MIWRALRRGLLMLLLSLLLGEVGLRAASIFAVERARELPSDPRRIVLSVGDSHTYGVFVPADESYPGRLQSLLDDRAPDTYAVINLGVPGMNTSQVLDRLRSGLQRYRPEAVIVWCGVNNAWNRAESTDTTRTFASQADRVITEHSRLYRFIRIWAHNRRIEHELGRSEPADRRYEVDAPGPAGARHRMTITIGGRTEEIQHERTAFHVDAEMEERALRDYRAMVETTRAAGARIVFLTYPVDKAAFAGANRAVRRLFAADGATIVETWRSIQRVSPEDRELLSGGHPNAAMYAEIARDIVPALLRTNALRAEPGLLAKLTFEAVPAEATMIGTCAPTTEGCASGTGCYRWNPSGGACLVRVPFSAPVRRVKVMARIRVESFPTSNGPRDLLAVLEDIYGTGVYVEVGSDGTLRLQSTGEGGRAGGCRPLVTRLRRGVWYGVRVWAEKSDHASMSLELLADSGAVLASSDCAGQATGGGMFTELRVGSGGKGGTSDVLIDDVVAQVTMDARPPPSSPPRR